MSDTLGQALDQLLTDVADKAKADPSHSYTAKLLQGGPVLCGKKLGDKHSLKRHVSSKGLCVLILRMILILSFVSHICWGGLTHLFTFEFIQFSKKNYRHLHCSKVGTVEIL